MNIVELIKAVIFGIVEGVAEWLPISSTGHLILLNELIPLKMSESFYESFEVIIQLGAVLAVLFCYKDRILPFSREKEQRKKAYALWRLALIGAVPSAVIGLLFDGILDEYLYNSTVVCIMLVSYGAAFILVERFRSHRTVLVSNTESMTITDALKVGAFQVLALVPGTSRSGATILGGMLTGLSRETAAEYSFFLAIPTMAGAGALKLVKLLCSSEKITGEEILLLAVGCAVAFLVSCLAIGFLTDFVKRHSFSAFGVYRIIFGGGLLIYFFTK
ncbi:MAG: undecaprenyl-diphosphate phosphatase [Ruminococcaceae bacterium]|nr:undecaprenyl-diphosphate phosphatase [Oscillospiraceae bacterium]